MYSLHAYLFIDQEEILNLALVQYCFDEEEHTVIFRPHTNFLSILNFRSMRSTLKKLKDVTRNLSAKFAINKCTSNDGLLIASSAGAIPHNRQL